MVHVTWKRGEGFGLPIRRVSRLEDLEGLSVKDSERIPHPTLLSRWEGLYWIDADLGVFRVGQPPEQRDTAHD